MDAFAKNIIEKTPIIFHDSFFETPNINQTDCQSFSNSFSRESWSSSIPDFDIIANTPAVLHINHDAENIRQTESLADMFERLKVDDIKKEIMSELQKWNLFNSWRFHINWNWWETAIKEQSSSKSLRFQKYNNW